MRQYYPPEVNPFPESFVPPNHGYRYATGGLANPRLHLGDWSWQLDRRLLRVPVSSTSMQGERGVVSITRAFDAAEDAP